MEVDRVEQLLDDCTDKERRFVTSYLGDARGNGARAAKLAGYKGAPSKSAAAVLRRPRIQALLGALRQRRVSPSLELSNDELRANIRQLVVSDIRDVIEWSNGDVRIRPSAELNGYISRGIQSLSVRSYPDGSYELSVSMHPKGPALTEILAVLEANENKRAQESGQSGSAKAGRESDRGCADHNHEV